MNQRPEQPPEGKLIAAALERSGLSIRQAAERAGISYGRWRQVTTGVQHVSPGEYAAVRAPAGTLAKMARAVGVTADELETEGKRPDAAAALRDLEEQPPPEQAAAVLDLIERARPQGWAGSTLLSPEIIARTDRLFMPEIRKRLAELAGRGIADPSGEELFPNSPRLAGAYQGDRLRSDSDPYSAAWQAALVAERDDRLGGRQHGSRHGSAGA